MSVVKRSVAFSQEVAAEADRRAGERGFSRLVNEAVEQHLQALRMAELYDDFVRRHGPVPADVKRDVADEWATLFDPS